MRRTNLPRSFSDAELIANLDRAAAELTLTKNGQRFTLRSQPDAYAICFSEFGGAHDTRKRNITRAVRASDPDCQPIVTFYRDGRVKLTTRGTNSDAMIQRIAACLPAPYTVRKFGCHVALYDLRDGDPLLADVEPIGLFLSSFVFTPQADAVVKGAA